jgi:hypothetical protein
MDYKPKSRNAVEKISGKLFVTQAKKNLALLLRGRIVIVQSLAIRS